MNAKRVKYSMVKEEIVPVLIEQDTEVDPEEEPEEDEEHVQEDDGQETQYTYAYTTGDDDDTETAVVTLSDRDHEALVNAEEVIIDENGHAVTLQELVENSTVEEETIEQGDGTHTILHIVPNIHGEEVEEDEELEDGEEVEHDDEFVTVDHEGGELEVEDDEVGSIVFESTIDHAEQDPYGRNKTFYCPNCGNCYSAAGSLKLHMRACLRQRNEISTDERKCKVCSKVFNSVAYLKEHMMRHTGEQPFRCTRCYRKFVEESKFTAHMESHKHQDKLEAEAVALAAPRRQEGGRQGVPVRLLLAELHRRLRCWPGEETLCLRRLPR
uniref:GM08802p n=1 Tax=Drosophila melanogaster TaxID=7227 RepID=Q95S50_DROME|nr:GM08802p [Drosophila melanogaster]